MGVRSGAQGRERNAQLLRTSPDLPLGKDFSRASEPEF